jgi:hypothetical protein
MQLPQSLLSLLLDSLFGIWGLITIILIALLIYRVTLASKEDDQIFIDAAEQHLYRQQQEVIAKMDRLRRPIIALTVISGALLLTTAGLWIYQGMKSF